MANTMTLINSSTVGSGGTNSVTFSSIPSTYTDLVIIISAKVSETGGSQDLAIRFNSDTGSNYTYKELYAYQTTVGQGGSTTTTRHNTITHGGGGTANTFNNVEIYIPNYSSSAYKASSVNATVENNTATSDVEWQIRMQAWTWNSTSAISAIQVYDPLGGNLVQYSTVYLYGIKNS